MGLFRTPRKLPFLSISATFHCSISSPKTMIYHALTWDTRQGNASKWNTTFTWPIYRGFIMHLIGSKSRDEITSKRYSDACVGLSWNCGTRNTPRNNWLHLVTSKFEKKYGNKVHVATIFLLKTFDMKHLEITRASRLRTPIEKLCKINLPIICFPTFSPGAFAKPASLGDLAYEPPTLEPIVGVDPQLAPWFRRIEKNRGSKTAVRKLQSFKMANRIPPFSWLEPEWVCWRLLARSQVKSAKLPLSDLEYVLFCWKTKKPLAWSVVMCYSFFLRKSSRPNLQQFSKIGSSLCFFWPPMPSATWSTWGASEVSPSDKHIGATLKFSFSR